MTLKRKLYKKDGTFVKLETPLNLISIDKMSDCKNVDAPIFGDIDKNTEIAIYKIDGTNDYLVSIDFYGDDVDYTDDSIVSADERTVLIEKYNLGRKK